MFTYLRNLKCNCLLDFNGSAFSIERHQEFENEDVRHFPTGKLMYPIKTQALPLSIAPQPTIYNPNNTRHGL